MANNAVVLLQRQVTTAVLTVALAFLLTWVIPNQILAALLILFSGTGGGATLTFEREDFEPLEVDAEWIRRLPAMPTTSGHIDPVGGYWVQYEDGFTSWSPQEAFERGYGEVGVQTPYDYLCTRLIVTDHEVNMWRELLKSYHIDVDLPWNGFDMVLDSMSIPPHGGLRRPLRNIMQHAFRKAEGKEVGEIAVEIMENVRNYIRSRAQ